MLNDDDATQPRTQLTSDYVLSQTNQSETVVAADSTRRNARIQPTITSINISTNVSVIPELSMSSNTSSNGSRPTNLETHNQDDRIPKNQPIFKLNALCVQALLYPVAIFVYLLIGAAIFTAIENEHNKKAINASNMVRYDEIQEAVETISRQFNLSQNTTREILDDLTYLCTNNYWQTQNFSYEWEFLPTFFFAATVITAIGML